MKPLEKWLEEQPKEFIDNVRNNEMFGDGDFDIAQLKELDEMFNPDITR